MRGTASSGSSRRVQKRLIPRVGALEVQFVSDLHGLWVGTSKNLPDLPEESHHDATGEALQ